MNNPAASRRVSKQKYRRVCSADAEHTATVTPSPVRKRTLPGFDGAQAHPTAFAGAQPHPARKKTGAEAPVFLPGKAA